MDLAWHAMTQWLPAGGSTSTFYFVAQQHNAGLILWDAWQILVDCSELDFDLKIKDGIPWP